MSQFSPPLSPSSASSPNPNHGVVNYNDVISELMCSMEGLSFGEASPMSASKPLSLFSEDRKQFILSPTITTTCGNYSNNGNVRFLREENGVVVDDVIAPDLAWVNDLLM